MSDEQTLERLQDWFIKRLGHAVDADSLVFKDEGLDSFDALNFIGFVETTFTIRLEADDIASPTFSTLRGVAKVVAQRRQRAS